MGIRNTGIKNLYLEIKNIAFYNYNIFFLPNLFMICGLCRNDNLVIIPTYSEFAADTISLTFRGHSCKFVPSEILRVIKKLENRLVKVN
jgi:hypothetical protein